jgi:hypothetical protein
LVPQLDSVAEAVCGDGSGGELYRLWQWVESHHSGPGHRLAERARQLGHADANVEEHASLRRAEPLCESLQRGQSEGGGYASSHRRRAALRQQDVVVKGTASCVTRCSKSSTSSQQYWPRKLPPNTRFRDLRHTCAALCIALGAHPKAIQERLGHSSITVTLDRYGHLFPKLGEALTDRLDQLQHEAAHQASPGAVDVRTLQG